MSITHTNRKDVTFYLCRGVTKTGKPRYFFAREPDKGEPVEAIPEGYEVVESVNGVVSLAKARPALIRPEERALVQAAVALHPKWRNYRVDVKDERIVVNEREGADPRPRGARYIRLDGLALCRIGRPDARNLRSGRALHPGAALHPGR